jgi:carbon storage regulator
MLVLSRRIGEQIVVPDVDVVFTVVSVHGGQVRLGVSAPAEVAVYREEVWHRIGDGLGSLPAKG